MIKTLVLMLAINASDGAVENAVPMVQGMPSGLCWDSAKALNDAAVKAGKDDYYFCAE